MISSTLLKLHCSAAVAALALASSPGSAATFHSNSIVVLGAGGQPANTPGLGVIDGVDKHNGLADTPSQVFLREYNFAASGYGGSASLQQTVNLPTVAATSGNRAFTLSSNSGSEGSLQRSGDGRYLTALGYNSSVPAQLITQSSQGQSAKFAASAVNRVVGRIGRGGDIDTTTALTDAYNGDNARGAVSADGTQFWTAGNVSGGSQANSGGVRYADLGATTSARVAGADNGFTRNINRVEIFDNQLYASSRNGAFSGIWAIGSGTAATTQGSGTPQQLFSYNAAALGGQGPYDFFLLSQDGGTLGSGLNTAYVADAIIGISKFTKDASNVWSLAYTFTSTGGRFETDGRAGGVIGLAGTTLADGSVELFGTTGFDGTGDTFGGNRLISLIDRGAASGYTILATAGATESFKGVALAPVPEPAAWALMLTGFALVGGMARRRNPVSRSA